MRQAIAVPAVVHDDGCAGVDRVVGARVIGRRIDRGPGPAIVGGTGLRVIAGAGPVGPRRDRRRRCARIDHVDFGELAYRGMSAALCIGKNPPAVDVALPTPARAAAAAARSAIRRRARGRPARQDGAAGVALGATCVLLAVATTGALGGLLESDEPRAAAATAASASAPPRIHGKRSFSSSMAYCTASRGRAEGCGVNYCAPGFAWLH